MKDGWYFTGKPCKNGHVAPRAKDSHCTECTRQRARSTYDSKIEYMKEWRRSNKDKCREYEQKWRDSTNGAVIKSSKRRAKERKVDGFYTEDDIAYLMDTQLACQSCHSTFSPDTPPTVDHKQPLSRGGTNWPSNLHLLCRSCNSSKGAKTWEEYLEYRKIKSGAISC